MFAFLGIMTAAGGLFLFLWYRTIAGLPVKQRPQFARPAVFKWGVPSVSLLVFAAGVFLLTELNGILAAAVMGAAALAFILIVRFDRYSADMRLIFDRYRKLLQANPGMEETEALFQTAAWRLPKWSHDRLVELVAGKNIEQLVLLMVINEYEISPISDWELFRTLKGKAARIIRQGR